MARPVRCIAVLAAMSSELQPLRRILGIPRSRWDGEKFSRGAYKGVTVLTAVTKMGLAAAQQTAEELFSTYGTAIDHLFVVGIAGANDLSLDIGQVVIPAAVVDARDGVLRYPENLCAGEPSGVIYSSDQLCYDSAFVAMLHSRNVALVDMESGAIAAVCDRHGCPFTIVRAVSDKVDEHAQSFDVFHLANADGSPRYLAAIRYVLGNPRRIGYLLTMARGAKKAIAASTEQLTRNIDALLSRA